MDLDPLPILDALGVACVASTRPVSGGRDTAIWRVEAGRGTFALRVFRPEQAMVCRREVVAMRAAASAGLPVPAVHVRGEWQGRPALLLSWCSDRPLLAALQAQPWRAWPLGVAFGRLHARIHAVAAPAALGGPPLVPEGGWIGWAGPDQVDLQARLRALDLHADALLHLDFHPLNVMSGGGRVTAVLDWANARAGDPRADFARTLTLLRLAPLPAGTSWLTIQAFAVVRRLLEWGWRRGYRLAAGATYDTRDLALFYAWAGAAMLHDLAPPGGRPGISLAPDDRARIQRWTDGWKRQAGLT